MVPLMRKRIELSGVLVALLFCLSIPAHADLIFSLDSPSFFGLPGSTIDISGTLLNPDLNPVFLNTASGVLTSADLDFDLTNLFTIVPRSLSFGDSYAGPIFGIIVGPQAQPGDYFGSFTIQGGVDENAFGDLATQNFQISVTGPTSVPEPSTLVLLATSMLGLVVLRRRSAIRCIGGPKRAVSA